jgi:hypothetical protein
MSSEIFSAYNILSWIYVYMKMFVLCGLRGDNMKLLYIYNIFAF